MKLFVWFDIFGSKCNFWLLFFLPFAEWQLEAAVREAFDVAYDNIYAFHLAQKSTEKSVENMKVCQL